MFLSGRLNSFSRLFLDRRETHNLTGSVEQRVLRMSFGTTVYPGRQDCGPPKDTHILIPETYKRVT